MLATITAVLVLIGQPDPQPLAAFVGDSGPGLCNMNVIVLNRAAEEAGSKNRYRCDYLE